MLLNRSHRGLLAQWWFTVDRGLMSAVLLLMAMGVLISMAASPPVAERIGVDPFHFFRNQLLFLLPAIVVFVGVSFLDQKQARRAALAVLVTGLVLMVAALQWGPEIKGAHRWINVGPINLQPSEFAKPGFVVMVSWFLSAGSANRGWGGVVASFILAGIFIGLLVLQPDFGQTALVVLTFGSMLLIYGIPWVVILGLVGLVSAGVVAAYALVPHVGSRIDRFFDPDKGDTFQVDTAVQAFSNGGLMGTGPGGGEAKLVLPDAHADFTFAVVGEEFGLIACLALLLLFAFIILKVLARAKTEPEPFPALAMAGLVMVFGFQTIINMGVNVSLLPAKGMTLPFISYGGSSLIGMAFAMGMVLAFARRRRGVTVLRPVTA